MKKTIYYAGVPGEGFGWGICNRELIKALGRLCFVDNGRYPTFTPDAVFMPIADHDLNPIAQTHGKFNIGYTFFEFALGPKAAENAKKFDILFCGSTWCKERLAERGIRNTAVLVQGVDHDIFKPGGKAAGEVGNSSPPGEFRIFSGGKFEYRKGQDIVLAAFKLLQNKYPQMRLVTCWENKWPQLVQGMTESPHVKLPGGMFDSWKMFWSALCAANDIDASRIFFSPSLSQYGLDDQDGLADLMRSTDLGVFPNRCEGGTNLVLMEYLACGMPAIATAGTGHLDICGYYPIAGANTDQQWVEISPEELASDIEKFASGLLRGVDTANAMRQWTWERAAKQILEAIP